jgi:hypothetical protein
VGLGENRSRQQLGWCPITELMSKRVIGFAKSYRL